MKRFLFTLLAALALPTDSSAKDTCLFVSQYQPDLTIELSTKNTFSSTGFMKYKENPLFVFETGLSKGYGGNFFPFVLSQIHLLIKKRQLFLLMLSQLLEIKRVQKELRKTKEREVKRNYFSQALLRIITP